MSDNFPFDKFIKTSKNSDLSDNNDISKYFSSEEKVNTQDLNQEIQILTTNQDNDELLTITNEILSIIQKNVPQEKFSTYFQSTFLVSSFNEDTIDFSVTTKFIKMMIENHYLGFINQAVIELMGKSFNINIEIINKTNNIDESSTNKVQSSPIIVNNPKNSNSVKDLSFKIDPQYTASREEIIDTVKSLSLIHI